MQESWTTMNVLRRFQKKQEEGSTKSNVYTSRDIQHCYDTLLLENDLATQP